DLLKREKRLEFPRILEIAKTVAEALDHAHERGLIHRDVKPENVLFTGGKACLGDFGIARAIDLSGSGASGTTSRNVVRGTPAYMSPEQAAGSQELDGRSDVFSLACVIYEMITGMQAYIGPTDEAVIAQRFVHPPRDLRVYRPSIPLALDTALQKAFAITPADRYRTASEMVATLDAALNTRPASERANESAAAPRVLNRSAIVGLLLLGTAAVVAGAFGIPRVIHTPDPLALDTTRIVLLPLDGAPDLRDAAWRHDDLFHEGLTRWRDVSVEDPFQVADALKRLSNVATIEDAAGLARSLGAGRFVRGKISARGDAWYVVASLYDAARTTSLYQASEVIPNDLSRASAAFASLADSLLLRGAHADSASITNARARSLPAVQAYGRAQTALGEWDLVAAESEFARAATLDAQYARAELWLAQVRAWQNPLGNTWGTFAERALANSNQLDEREARLAAALVQLSRGEFDAACDIYESLARRKSRDFAAWFGIGQCNMMNKTVIADHTSPSKWRFKASAHRGMIAYAKAFEILPSVYRGYERGAFQRLRELMLLSNQMTVGYGDQDSATFYARPGWIGDSLVLLPYLAAEFASAPAPPGLAEAIRRRRSEFRRLAATWSAAFPRSSGAKHAVAISLEMIGDPAAIDTIRLARSLADGRARTQLAVAEALLLLKFGVPDRTDLIEAVRTLSDSVLAANRREPGTSGRVLIPLAVLTGQCDLALALTRETSAVSAPRGAPLALYSESNAILVGQALECGPHWTLQQLAVSVTEAARATGAAVGLLDGQLLLRPALMTGAPDSLILQRLVSTSQHPLAAAAVHALRGQRRTVEGILEADRRGWGRQVPTADFGYARARILLAMGDTVSATSALEQLLTSVHTFEPNELAEVGRIAGLMAALRLRTDLAARSTDRSSLQKWTSVLSALGRNRITDHASQTR
ncbi:MAG: protein kinase domain-containing protein, partial [Gemmatimonadaceae bacterium]